jgi:integrase
MDRPYGISDFAFPSRWDRESGPDLVERAGSAALVGPAVERGKDSDFKMLGEGRGWRDQNGGVGRVCSVASGSGSHLQAWREQSPYAKDGDFVFPSLKAGGRVPLSASIFVADHLRPAAKKAGVHIEDGQRFGLHNLRHSLSNWLVNKAKVEPKTVQGILRHARIQTTLDLYTQNDSDETRAAQGEYLTALGVGTQLVQ